MQPPQIVTRFAPSPTGHLHIGGARTALFCWALTKRRPEIAAGRFLLRIEDTDQKRSTEAAAAGILADLAWLGIDWDEGPAFTRPAGGEEPSGPNGGAELGGDARGVGPFFQSKRLDLYNAAFERLIAEGHAYPAFETPEELAAMRAAAEQAKKTFIYRRADDYHHAAALERAKAEEHVLRFRVPAEDVVVSDRILGEITFPHAELDDPIIRKRDGFPTYHFAVVVDDAAMGVTHVLRGQEHLNNTPKHAEMFRALGHEPPAFAHLPIITNPDGSKMSKRDKDRAVRTAVKDAGGARPAADGAVVAPSVSDEDFEAWLKDKKRQLPPAALREIASVLGATLPEIEVEDFRRSGYLPEVVCNFIALLGWSPGEKDAEGRDVERFGMGYLAERFELERVGRSSAKFDREKLLAFNADAIQHEMSDDEFARRWRAWAEEFDPELTEALSAGWGLAAMAARPRSRTFADGRTAVAFALTPDDGIVFDEKAVQKVLRKGDPPGLTALPEIAEVLETVEPWEPGAVEAAVSAHAERSGLGMKKVAQPLRVALTGTAVSPPLGQAVCLLPRESVVSRVRRCVELHTE